MATKKIPYYFKYSDQCGIVYSIDKMTVNFRLKPNFFGKLIAFLRKHKNCTEREEDTKRSHYRYFFEIKYGHYVMVITFSINDVKPMDGKIIVNPNKCFDDTECIDDIIFIRTLCCMFELSRIDLAMDIQEEKRLVHMMGVRRKVSYYNGRKRDCKLSSEQKELMKDICDDDANYTTEYHGTKGHKTIDGYCKLYFKTFECGTDEIVTRFEMTLITSGKKSNTIEKIIDKFFSFMPELFISRETDFAKLSNDKFFKKHEKVFEILNRVHNPYRVLKEELESNDGNKKLYSRYEQKEFLKRLDLQYIEPQRTVIKVLLEECYSIMDKFLSYSYEDIADMYLEKSISEDTVNAIEEVTLPVIEFGNNNTEIERNAVYDW